MKPMDLTKRLLRIELRHIERALLASKGCKALAARLLGLKRTTLVMRLQKLEREGIRPKAV